MDRPVPAESEGSRMCDCNPKPEEAVSVICELLNEFKAAGRTPSVDDWAAQSGISKGHIHRVLQGKCEPSWFVVFCLVRCLGPIERFRAAQLMFGPGDAHARLTLLTFDPRNQTHYTTIPGVNSN